MAAAAVVAMPEQPLPTKPPAQRPDAAGRFGRFGGKYVPETLIAALAKLEQDYRAIQADPTFQVRILQRMCTQIMITICTQMHDVISVEHISLSASYVGRWIEDKSAIKDAADSLKETSWSAERVCGPAEGLCRAPLAAVPCRAAIRALQTVTACTNCRKDVLKEP
jgi:hypothetical protein